MKVIAAAKTGRILGAEIVGKDAGELIHCFTASAGFAETVLALGLTISLSGIVTFKSARDLQAVAQTIPAEAQDERDVWAALHAELIALTASSAQYITPARL